MFDIFLIHAYSQLFKEDINCINWLFCVYCRVIQGSPEKQDPWWVKAFPFGHIVIMICSSQQLSITELLELE